MLADLLADPARLDEPVGPEAIDDIRAGLDAAAREAGAVGGWTEDAPLRLAKGTVTWLVRCPRRALTPDAPSGVDDLVLGLIVDAAAKLATLGARRPITVPAALAYLEAQGDEVAAGHLDALGEGAGPLLVEAVRRVEDLTTAWPVIAPGWWPRVEEPVRARLAAGTVTLTGRLDMLLGGPPTPFPAVVVEVKAGRWYDGMRGDAHLYALLVALRDGVAPAAAVTVVADGTTQVEPIRASLLRHAAERVEAALQVAAPLAAGEAPEARPGPHCPHCPARPDCGPGRRWLDDHGEARDAAPTEASDEGHGEGRDEGHADR